MGLVFNLIMVVEIIFLIVVIVIYGVIYKNINVRIKGENRGVKGFIFGKIY